MSPFKTVLFFVTAALIGFALMPRLRVDLQPDTRLPKLTVYYALPDAPPEVTEQEATTPLENAFAQLTQLKSVYSVSNYGQGSIELTFDRHADIAFKKFEVASLIRQVYPKLHPQLTYPEVEQRSREGREKTPLLVYRINASLAPFQISKTTEQLLVTPMARVSGVSQVILSGAENLQLTIRMTPVAETLGVTSKTIQDRITEEFTTHYPGAITNAAGQKLLVTLPNPLTHLSQLEEILVPTSQQHAVPLKTVARVYLEERTPQQLFRINGLNSITLSIYADEGVNRLALARTLRKKMRSLQPALPRNYQVELDADDTEFLANEINKNFTRLALSLSLLTLFALLSYRKWSYLAILFSGLLISLGLTALAAYVLNISIHLYTIAGITISFGLLLDNAIVVTDHLHRHRNTTIVRAVMGATLTTMIALLLVLFLPEEERLNLSEFCIIVALALAASILTALFYTPAVAELIRTGSKTKSITAGSLRTRAIWFVRYAQVIAFLARHRRWVVTLMVLAFGLPLFMLPTQWKDHEWYNRTIGSELYQEKIRPYVDRLTGGALRLFVLRVYERSGYRDPERTRLYVYAELPYGNTLQEMNRIISQFENYLAQTEGIDKFITQVYSGQYASIVISFKKEYEKGALPYLLKSRLIARSLDWGGVSWNIFGVGQGFSNAGYESLPSFRVEMTGYNYHELERQANVLARKLLAHKRIQQVNTNERLEWNEKAAVYYALKIDPQATTSGGIIPAQALQSVYQNSLHHQPDFYIALNHTYLPVFFHPQEHAHLSVYDITEQSWNTGQQHLKLSEIGELKQEKFTNAIHKRDRQYIRVVGFEYYGSSKFGNEYLDKMLDEMKQEMPVGYAAKKLTWSWNWQKVKRQYSLLAALLAGVYVICAILFESLRQPLYIILTVPLSFIGLFLTFAWGEFYFDQGGYAAFVLLGGLVVNAGIFIINDLNNLKSRNYNRAVCKAVTGKMQPILLTVLSTCFGLIPFLTGGQSEIFWFALAAGTTGGLVVSLPVAMVMLPVLLWKNKT